MHRIFVSDLHLDKSQPQITNKFFNFLNDECTKCDELYILGDLFNVWVSDKEKTEYQLEVAKAISSVKAKKFFLPGNRDFLLGKLYCKQCNMTLIKDETIIQNNELNKFIILCHGDSLCTLDIQYQKFRKFRSNPINRFLFGLLPLKKKQKLANNVKNEAKSQKKLKDPKIMDIVDEDFFKLMKKNNCTICIHGHTHKPFVHAYEEQNLTRYVLGDWTDLGFTYLEEIDGNFNLIKHN